MDMHPAVLNMENQQGPAEQHRELCSVLCGSLDGRGACRRMDPWICATESLHCPPEIITTLLIDYTTIVNSKSKLNKEGNPRLPGEAGRRPRLV